MYHLLLSAKQVKSSSWQAFPESLISSLHYGVHYTLWSTLYILRHYALFYVVKQEMWYPFLIRERTLIFPIRDIMLLNYKTNVCDLSNVQLM